jgi:hypothetical protein
MTHLQELLKSAGGAIGGQPSQDATRSLSALGPRQQELVQLLEARNGFFAFENALHVLPISSSANPRIELQKFNFPSGWKAAYWDGCCEDILFFAINLFGILYGIQGSAIVRFDNETGNVSPMAANIDEWAGLALNADEIGWSFGSRWQRDNRPLDEGQRLMPYPPFVAGGSLTVSHFKAVSIEDLLGFYGSFATQIREIPDGGQIKVVIKRPH